MDDRESTAYSRHGKLHAACSALLKILSLSGSQTFMSTADFPSHRERTYRTDSKHMIKEKNHDGTGTGNPED